jgi:hypothetical protein
MMFFLFVAFLVVLAVAGLLGWTADSRDYANLPTNGDMPRLRPRA